MQYSRPTQIIFSPLIYFTRGVSLRLPLLYYKIGEFHDYIIIYSSNIVFGYDGLSRRSKNYQNNFLESFIEGSKNIWLNAFFLNITWCLEALCVCFKRAHRDELTHGTSL